MKTSILFNSVRSPHCLKVAMFMGEKNIPFERCEINLPTREQKTPEYLAINPLGQVPVYEDDASYHIDSLVIMRYLDELYPENRLFPAEPGKLQQALDWIELSSTKFRDVSHHLYWLMIEPPADGADPDEIARLKAQGARLLRQLDQTLENREWIMDTFSVVDLAVFPWVYGYTRFDLITPEYPHVIEWRQRIAARPTFAANYQKAGYPFQEYLARKINS